jgi:hypothetical protein
MPTLPGLAKTPIHPDEVGLLGTRWTFVGIDLAPNESLETGIVALDRSKNIIRTDKLYTNDDILLFLDNIGPANNLIVSIDLPKSLSIPGKWRQEEIKFHPLRLNRQGDEKTLSRFAQRATDLFYVLQAKGMFTVVFINTQARMRYDMNIPYRSRSPQGCRALQALIKLRLGIPNVPSNLAPSSVLDAMIAAYTAWSVYKGTSGVHYQLYQEHLATSPLAQSQQDVPHRIFMDPLLRVPPEPAPRKRRR